MVPDCKNMFVAFIGGPWVKRLVVLKNRSINRDDESISIETTATWKPPACPRWVLLNSKRCHRESIVAEAKDAVASCTSTGRWFHVSFLLGATGELELLLQLGGHRMGRRPQGGCLAPPSHRGPRRLCPRDERTPQSLARPR